MLYGPGRPRRTRYAQHIASMVSSSLTRYHTQAELERCLWCCRAASVPSRSRIRVLGTLSSILFSRDRTFQADSPIILQTLLQALFSLRYSLSLSSHSASEMESLAGYVAAICNGSCGELSSSAIEMEFGVRFAQSDTETLVRDILVTESLIRCLQVGDVKNQRWMLRTMLAVRLRYGS